MMGGVAERIGLLIVILAVAVSCAQVGEEEDVLERPAATRLEATGSVTWYVRPDGGSAGQCTGLVDAPYPGRGSGQDCAWDHPFRALPPEEEPRIRGGDTLVIAPSSYMMGYGAPGAEICEADYPWDCHMAPVPSGPNPEMPTRILGAGWESGCSERPELWGTERVTHLLDLTGSINVEIGCLELTDHSSCVEDHSGGLACNRDDFPFGEWAADGLYAEDSVNVTLHDLDIHGLAAGGIRAGRLADWIVEDVRIAANGWVGWEGDIEGDDANRGTMLFRRLSVEWNGCGESYPGGEPSGCWGQSAGGYGDGLGTGETGGEWIFEDSAFLHNTSDGLDLFYARLDGSSITVRRTISEGNAGDQFKSEGPATYENVVAVSQCGFFEGQPFTHQVDACRAGGSAIALTLRPGNQVTVINATLTGQGDCLLIVECKEGENCSGSERVLLRNNIFAGHPEFGGGGDVTCLAWHNMEQSPMIFEAVIAYGVKDDLALCPSGSMCNVEPGFVNGALESFDGRLGAGSPAINGGIIEDAPSDDFEGRPRDANPDIGAYEGEP